MIQEVESVSACLLTSISLCWCKLQEKQSTPTTCNHSISQSTCHACRAEQARAMRELEDLQAALEAREAQMAAIQSSSSALALKQSYDRVVAELAQERDELQKERTQLLQVLWLCCRMLLNSSYASRVSDAQATAVCRTCIAFAFRHVDLTSSLMVSRAVIHLMTSARSLQDHMTPDSAALEWCSKCERCSRAGQQTGRTWRSASRSVWPTWTAASRRSACVCLCSV